MTDYAINPLIIIAGSLAFIAGLAWNSAIQATIDKYYSDDHTLKSKYVYAIIVTVIIVVASLGLMYLNRHFSH